MKKEREYTSPRTYTAPRILVYLASNSPSNKWKLSKALGKSYGNVHETMQMLLGFRFLYVSKQKPSSKNPGLKVDYYSLTIKGLVMALLQESAWEQIDVIAKKCVDLLPLVFGKWSFFDAHDVKEFVKERLRQTVESCSSIVLLERPQRKTLHGDISELASSLMKFDMKTGKSLNPAFYSELRENSIIKAQKAHKLVSSDFDAFLRYEICRDVFLGSPVFTPKDQSQESRFLTVLKKDRDLKRFINSTLIVMGKQWKSRMKNLRLLRKRWQDLPD